MSVDIYFLAPRSIFTDRIFSSSFCFMGASRLVRFYTPAIASFHSPPPGCIVFIFASPSPVKKNKTKRNETKTKRRFNGGWSLPSTGNGSAPSGPFPFRFQSTSPDGDGVMATDSRIISGVCLRCSLLFRRDFSWFCCCCCCCCCFFQIKQLRFAGRGHRCSLRVGRSDHQLGPTRATPKNGHQNQPSIFPCKLLK